MASAVPADDLAMLPEVPEALRTASLSDLWKSIPVHLVAQTVGITCNKEILNAAIEAKSTVGKRFMTYLSRSVSFGTLDTTSYPPDYQ